MTNRANEPEAMKEGAPGITGIGGIFFFSDNPQKTQEWYVRNLGLRTDDYGGVFEFRNAHRPEEVNQLRWTLFKNNDEYFKPSEKPFMINYTVRNIEGLVSKLRSNGVTILGDIQSYDFGKFVHILDPEGNKVELWEPR